MQILALTSKAYVFNYKDSKNNDIWGRGYGKQAIGAVVNDYAPAIIENRAKFSLSINLQGKTFNSIVATTRVDNVASLKILSKTAGMQRISEGEKFGHNRYTFFVSVDEILERKKQVDNSKEKLSVSMIPTINK